MTDLDRMKLERDTLDKKIGIAERNQAFDRAREAFRLLGADSDLPVLDILEQALADWSPADPNRRRVGAVEFIERLSTIVETYRR